MPYATRQQLKTYRDFEGVDDDGLLDALLVRASGIIDSLTDTNFEAASDARSFDSLDGGLHRDGRILYVDRHLATIASVTNGDGTTVSSSDYVTLPRNDTPYYAIELRSGVSLTWEPNAAGEHESAITIDGLWGYSASDNTPVDVTHACIRLAGWLYQQRETDVDLDRPLLTGDGITIMPTRLPRDVMDIVMKYRRGPIA